MDKSFIGVHIFDCPYYVDHEYTYFVPLEFRDEIDLGKIVSVPFGGGNKNCLAIVTKIYTEEPKIKTKTIISVSNSDVSLDNELLSLCFYMKEHTLCTIGDAVHTMIPKGALSKIKVYYSAASKTRELSSLEENIYKFIEEKPKAELLEIKKAFGNTCQKVLAKLCDDKILQKETSINQMAIGESKFYYFTSVDESELSSLLGEGKEIEGYKKLRSEKQRQILSTVFENGGMERSKLISELQCTSQQIKTLLDKEYLSFREDFSYRSPTNGKKLLENKEFNLNNEQQISSREIEIAINSKKPNAFLLHGITGSGKTVVIMDAIDKALKKGLGVIMLIPEISLTPQTVDIFCSRYGDTVTLIHSLLSVGERLDAFMKIKRGESKLCIGTRSAIFAPMQNLGLIIIDEEQEHTYKSDTSPKYHARDIARFRTAKNNATLILASATPSIESYKKAIDGKYKLLELNYRHGNAVLPSVELVDMREEIAKGNTDDISEKLIAELTENQKKHEQSILFLNRRGYHNFISCQSCGEAVYCDNCSVPMTYHTDKRYKSANLVCHWCGKRMAIPEKCPKCESTHIVPRGIGIQYVSQKMSEYLPQSKIIQMDTDTTSVKGSYEEMLDRFRSHKADILLGTQMVTKGHDFPLVTLVGVINADNSLYLNDYRAHEKTFSMLTQVIGRAGRGDIKGRAIIQTSNPDSDIIRLAIKQDYKTFFKGEIETRRLLKFPPFCDIVLLTVSGKIEEKVLSKITRVFNQIKDLKENKYKTIPLIMFGPFEAPVYKVEGSYRMRIIAKCILNNETREMFAEVYGSDRIGKTDESALHIDFNPSSL